ncbi:hypothetical protein CEXT_224301 [Caerostris extrusa]|uniref:Uncharacterized protein n=1 Tax=Caerostris extrusa TaxID=172846 RepID=A0AAV4XFK9_CAEEX|nr:hypothetical protein CEXT_224301 [Caerostris extrusa]
MSGTKKPVFSLCLLRWRWCDADLGVLTLLPVWIMSLKRPSGIDLSGMPESIYTCLNALTTESKLVSVVRTLRSPYRILGGGPDRFLKQIDGATARFQVAETRERQATPLTRLQNW